MQFLHSLEINLLLSDFLFVFSKLCLLCRYNFLLFPRDELKLGMPAYSFLCQTSHLASMARQDFDFNTCIYEGEVWLYSVFSFFFVFLMGWF